MSWAKLDDGFWMHPKIIIVGNAGGGVFARMLSYCGCYLTDGLVPEGIAATIAGPDTDALAALVDIGLIERLESGGYHVPDYLEHNPTKVEVEEVQRQRREAGRAGGIAKARANGKRGLRRVS